MTSPAPLGPPPDVSPPRLFRLLVARPRPEQPIAFRFAGVEHAPLVVRAPLACEVNAALDVAPSDAAAAALVAVSLYADGARLFGSAADVLDLPDVELPALTRDVLSALARIAPMYGRCNEPAWHEALVRGSQHPSNRTAWRALAGSVDIVLGAKRPIYVERPDRYFGVPLADLTDGQWMAFRAALNDRHE